MKRKFLSLLAGMAAIAIVAAPGIATAESPPLIAQQTAQSENPFEQIDLTGSQKQQIQAIWADVTKDLGRVVTPAQQKRFLEARKNGKTLQEARDAMELSETQQKKIRQILQAANQRSLNVLTPEQRNKIEFLSNQPAKQ